MKDILINIAAMLITTGLAIASAVLTDTDHQSYQEA